MGKTLASGILAVVLVAGCGSGGGTATAGAAAGNGASTARCAPASGTLLAAISQGLTVSGGGTLRSGYVVKSNDFAKVWMVAAEIDGSGMEKSGDVGVWATNDPNGAGMIFAVDGMAKEFSDWGDGSKTDAQFSLSDDGISVAKACAGK